MILNRRAGQSSHRRTNRDVLQGRIQLYEPASAGARDPDMPAELAAAYSSKVPTCFLCIFDAFRLNCAAFSG